MADPFVEVMGPLGVLRERIEVTLAEQGLKAIHIGIVPGLNTEGPHEVQILATMGDDPPSATDEEFEAVIKGSREAELDQSAEQARHELIQRMEDPGGFL